MRLRPCASPRSPRSPACAGWGRGDEKAADQAAVDAMRSALNVLDIDGTVVIGEGERDEAPMLYIGEKVGTGKGPKVDIALDPLEGTTITATGGPNSIACIAFAAAGRLLERARHLYGEDRDRRRPARRPIGHHRTARRKSRALGRGQEMRHQRSRRPDPRSAPSSGADCCGARDRRAHPADRRWRRRRRDRHLARR